MDYDDEDDELDKDDSDRYGFDVSPGGEDSRYRSAHGWEPPDTQKKLRDKYRKDNPEKFCYDSLLEVRNANKWLSNDVKNKPQRDLLGGLWHPGEVVVMFAETGMGKSIFATQIAELIARGRSIEPFTRPEPQKVLYLDFELTETQFTRRYICPHPVPGKLSVKYRFASNFKRTGYDDPGFIPSAFKGDLARYFHHSINLAIKQTDANILIIDNLSYLDIASTSNSAHIRRMHSLKLMAVANEMSILVITHAKHGDRRLSSPVSRPLSLSGIALGPQIAQIADSVFAIGRSTFAPDIRYIKHLKSTSSAIEYGSDNVLTYRIERTPGPTGPRGSLLARRSYLQNFTPHSERLTTHVSGLSSPVSSPPSSLPASRSLTLSASPVSPSPFLGFTFLGIGPESDHHRDYAAEALEAELDHQKALHRLRTRSAREAMVHGIIDGSYDRYLKS